MGARFQASPALLMAALAAAGCGFTGEDLFPGRRTPGVAPFRDRGLVMLCEQDPRFAGPSRRLAGPRSTPSGLCVREPPPSCLVDADCGAREQCICGACQVPLCDTGLDCPPGWECNFGEHRCERPCRRDDDCSAGESCPAGVRNCRGRCATDGECSWGERCLEGACRPALADGRPCTANTDCAGAAEPVCMLQRIPADVREPAALHRDVWTLLFFERVTPGGASIWVTTSRDSLGDDAGRRFLLTVRPAISPDASDGGRVGAPSVLLVDGAILMAYANGNGAIRLAWGGATNFTAQAEPALVPKEPWEMSGLDSPSLAYDPNGAGILLYYGVRDGSAIGLATSPSGLRFERVPGPILRPSLLSDPAGTALFRDVERVVAPFAQRVTAPDGTAAIWLWLAARGRESGDARKFGEAVPGPLNFSIALVGSADGRTFTSWPWNPVFDRAAQFLEHRSELDPSVVDLSPDRRLLYYRAQRTDDAPPDGIGVAESP